MSKLTQQQIKKYLNNYVISINAGIFHLDYLMDTGKLASGIYKLQKEIKPFKIDTVIQKNC